MALASIVVTRDRCGGCFATQEEAYASARRAVYVHRASRVVLYDPDGPGDPHPYHHVAARACGEHPGALGMVTVAEVLGLI